MRQFLTVTLLLVTVFVALAGVASATVMNVAYWRGGENDVPAPLGTWGNANATAVDGTGNGFDLDHSVGFGPTFSYPGDYPAGVGLPAGSAVGYSFYNDGGGNSFTRNTPVTIGTSNWGVQLFVKPDTANSGQYYIQNGNGANGFLLMQLDLGAGTHYYGEAPGSGFGFDGGAVDTSHWHNIAMVNDGGVFSAYRDGVLVATSAPGKYSTTPTAFMGLGQNASGGGFYAGGIDEARIFMFTPGAFQVSDLSGYVGIVPEPCTLTLLSIGVIGLLAYAWRKRR